MKTKKAKSDSPFKSNGRSQKGSSVGSHGSTFGGGAKDGARYRQLQQRIRGQDEALIESLLDKIKRLEKELEMAKKKLVKSGTIVKELAACVEFYRSKLPRYQVSETVESDVASQDDKSYSFVFASYGTCCPDSKDGAGNDRQRKGLSNKTG